MKTIIAFIKPHKLDDVTLALQKLDGLTGMSVSTVHGFGRGKASEDVAAREEHVRIEIVCLDDLIDEAVSTIEQAAHTGLRGDGKIYVYDVESAVRISTGERGDDAC